MKKALMISGLVLAIAACGADKEGKIDKEKKIEKPRIGVAIYKFDDNFMALLRKNLNRISSAAGLNLDLVDSQNNQSAQNDQVDVFLSKGIDSLAINLVDPASASTIINKAKTENIPIVFFNKEPNEKDMNSYDRVYYVGTDSKASGVIQGELVAKHWEKNKDRWDLNKDGKIQLVLLKGEPGHPDAEARTKWVQKTLNDKGIKTELLQIDTAMWDTAMAKDKMDAWVAGPNKDKIEVVIANNDGMAFGAIESLKAAGKTNIPVFGIDALPEALEKIEKGELEGTVLNDAKNQAQATFDLAKNLAEGKKPLEGTKWKLDDKKAVRVPYLAVDKDNLAKFK